MDSKLVDAVLARHRELVDGTQVSSIVSWMDSLYELLFPLSHKSKLTSPENVYKVIEKQKSALLSIMQSPRLKIQNPIEKADQFYGQVFTVYQHLEEDLKAKFGESELKMTGQQIRKLYPQFSFIFYYRISNWFTTHGYKTLGDRISKSIQNQNRVCIHHGSTIGPGFVIQNGHNIQVGEHVKIGKNVKIYEQVTIGTFTLSESAIKSQIVIQDDVVIFSGAIISGDKTIIGKGSIIGNRVVIHESVLPNSKILSTPLHQITPKNSKDLFTIHGLIGNTPLVEIKNIFKHPHVKIYAKLQGQNPGGSVKDRPAYNMIKQALKRGDIKPGMKLIEPTSGNTGIALAMIACVYNLDIELVMPENSTAERVQTMEAYGAKVILTPAKGGIQGSRDYAEAQVAKGGYTMLNQFANTDNYMAHYYSTGPELWRDTKGTITHFVSSMGTTGTIMGTSLYLKQKSPQIKIVGVQPTQGAKIPGIRRWTPEYLPKIFNKDRVDQTIDVSQQQSLEMMRRMAKEEAIFAGMSSGGAMAAAVRLAKTLERGVIVSIVCDRGDRYLSSGIFGNVPKV